MERLIERVADELSMDPVRLRDINMVRNDEIPFISVGGTLIESGSPADTMRNVVEDSRFYDLRSSLGAYKNKAVGVGLAVNTETTVPSLMFQTGIWGGTEHVSVAITPGGEIVVKSGAVSMGTNIATALAQIAASEFGVNPDEILVVLGDTDSTPFSTGLWGSRGCAMIGSAVQNACKILKDKIAKIAAWYLEANPADIIMENHSVYVRGHPERKISLREVSRIAYNEKSSLPEGVEPGLEVSAVFEAPNISRKPDEKGRINVSGATTNAAHVAVVEVDLETFQIRLLSYYICHDSGLLINPAVVENQVIGGLAQSIGATLYEHQLYSGDGIPLASTFADYLIPDSTSIPTVHVKHSGAPSPYILVGAKGVGESGTIAAPAAIANAVEDALKRAGISLRLVKTPIYPHELWGESKSI